MATNYAIDKLTTAIKTHLLTVDAIPQTAAPKLASELAQVCLTEFNTAGLDGEKVENIFTPSAFKAKAGGVDSANKGR